MGNEQSGKYVVRYPDGFDEKHTEVDHGLAQFKDKIAAAQRSGKGASGIRERAANRKELKGYELGIEDMQDMKIKAMANKKLKFTDDDVAKWTEMLDGLKELYQQCKTLVEQSGRSRKAGKKASKEGTSADDFLRGDGGQKAPGKSDGGNSPSLRTGQMSEQEKQAMREINAKEAVMDDMTDQISDNLEYLQMTAEMIGEEIDAQQELVEEVNERTKRVKKRTENLNDDVQDTMEKDGMKKEKDKKKKGGLGKDVKSKIAGSMVKSMLGGS